jgi:polysaccharide export outer membrane protein
MNKRRLPFPLILTTAVAVVAIEASLVNHPARAAEPQFNQNLPPVVASRPRVWAPDTSAAPVGPQRYTLNRGDKLRIVVFGRDDLTSDYRVSDLGQLRIPQIGVFEATGKSADILEGEVRTALERLTQRQAYVSLDVIERRPFYIVGLVTKPGAYPYVPGMTVLHAMALAGGLYRASNAAGWMAAELTRETYRQQQGKEDLKRLLSRRARLLAERAGEHTIEAPAELTKLVGATAAQAAVKAETAAIERQWQLIEREEASQRATIELLKKEIVALNEERGHIAEQRAIRDKQLDDLKKLAGKGLAQNQRLYDTQMAIALLERDAQEAIANISRAQRNLERANRDLNLVRLERKVKIDKELEKVDEDISRSRATLESARRITDQYSGAPGNSRSLETDEPTLDFEIMRRDDKGNINYVEAIETTSVEPGDVLRVTPRVK